MNDTEANQSGSIDEILTKLESIEKRLGIVEYELRIDAETLARRQKANEKRTGNKEHDDNSMESKIGGYGLALLGNVVFFFGILFLSHYIQI